MKYFIQSLRILPRWVIILLDLIMLILGVSIAFYVLFGFDSEKSFRFDPIIAIVLFVFTGLLSILTTKSYSGIVRYTSLQDAVRIFYSMTLALFLAVSINIAYELVHERLTAYSLLLIAYLNAIFLMIGYRIIVKEVFAKYLFPDRMKETPVAIFGAGQSGIITKQLLDTDSSSAKKVVAFFDDNKNKAGTVLNGSKIFIANEEVMKAVIRSKKIKEIIISIQNIELSRKNEFVDFCLSQKVKVLYVPPLDTWVQGELSIKQIQDIQIEDLLGRDSINLENDTISKEVRNKTILVSGAAGSIGSELCRQIIRYAPRQLILLDQSETGLYEIELECKSIVGKDILVPAICDIRDKKKVDQLIKTYRPDLIFHAAAYKHVPMMESNPSEAILCNIMGTKHLADSAQSTGVKKFVMISTDKAVNPTNVMGASKRIAEMYVQALNSKAEDDNNEKSTEFITTRFGNVLGSNGSVIPLFKKQIEQGGPLTITHPEITRYFMTIPEACQLVLEAGSIGKGGEILIFDMGKSVKIIDLARRMILLSGLEPEKDIQFKFTGLRDGEKLYEELLNVSENTITTHHEKILKAKVNTPRYSQLRFEIDRLLAMALEHEDEYDLVGLMKHIVPEYKSNFSRFEILDKKKLEAN
ncbi:MAG: polysaccharide biosynthesis protein [Cyclobacteriaceae bacterium]|nr:polysaccharide biosynthesis protein [Cyclobacteriaceae bacterium]MCH8515574.1 polysaccharide biosynthesis protein [Cyclobacteriaceae bacterium]